MMNETTSLTLQTHSVDPLAVEDIDLHYKPSLSLYRLLLMFLVAEYSRQLIFYQIIHYQVMIWWIETVIQVWE